jgi:hypothetical protein
MDCVRIHSTLFWFFRYDQSGGHFETLQWLKQTFSTVSYPKTCTGVEDCAFLVEGTLLLCTPMYIMSRGWLVHLVVYSTHQSLLMKIVAPSLFVFLSKCELNNITFSLIQWMVVHDWTLIGLPLLIRNCLVLWIYDYILAFILNVAVVWVVIQNEDIVRIGICPMGMQHLVLFASCVCVC